MTDSPYVTLNFAVTRTVEGEDIGGYLRDHLGPDAEIKAVLGADGAVESYELHVPFPTPEEAFDGALALRNWLAENGMPCQVD